MASTGEAEPGEIAHNEAANHAADARALRIRAIDDPSDDSKDANQQQDSAKRPEQQRSNKVEPTGLSIQPDIDILEPDAEQEQNQTSEKKHQEEKKDECRSATSRSQAQACVDPASP